MGVLFFFAMVCTAAASIFVPWIGVVYAYLFVVLTPQAVWFWDFGGWRPEFWVLLLTCIGVAFGVLRQKFTPSILLSKRNGYMLGLWATIVLSYYFGPYTNVGGPYRWDNAPYALQTFNKIFVLYFIACLTIDTERKLKWIYFVLVGSSLYLIYWANRQYLTGHGFGRLAGPVGVNGAGIYQDQNNFAMMFVVAQSFLWFTGFAFRRSIFRWVFWLSIPFCWHAVFLTGSRGGLLGLGVTTFLIAIRSKQKKLGFALIPALIFVFLWQGGSIMKERAVKIDHYHHNASAEGRLESWRAGFRMMKAHPFTGVGLASYGPAFPQYSDQQPREAHDTLIQIAAESGVIAGGMYVLIVLTNVIVLWRNGNVLKRKNSESSVSLLLINEATLIGFCGLIVCSIFLSLQRFEIFYLLSMMANTIMFITKHNVLSNAP